MAPNHGLRRALGRRTYALATCAVVTLAGLATGVAATAHGASGAPASVLTNTTLTSVGTDGGAAAQDNARPAISANGRYVAFQSDAPLNVSGSVLPPAPSPTVSPTTTASATPPPTIPPSTSPPPPPPSTTPPPPPPSTTPPPPPPSTTLPPPPPSPSFSPPRAPVAPSPAAAPGAPPAPPADNGASRVYVRDQTGKTTSLLSDPSTGNAMAPSISGTGKLVSYLFAGNLETNVVVVNRQATGTGPFDTKANLAVKTVTGTPNDLPFQRILPCPSGIGDGGAIRTTPCGPELSADGSTLVYPAQQSPISPSLFPTSFGDPIPGNLVDFGTTSTNFTFDREDVDYTVEGTKPVTLTGFTVSDPSFTISPQEGPSCIGTLQPGTTCSINVDFDSGACPDATPTETKEITATLQTDSPVPDGQSSLALVVFCNEQDEGDARPLPGASRDTAKTTAKTTAAAACPAPPKGLPVVTAPPEQFDNNDNDVVDFGPTVIGQPFAAIVTFSGIPFTDTVAFSSPDCGLQLIDPATIGQPAGPSVSCKATAESDTPTCTAYMLVTPGAVGTDVAMFSGSSPQEGNFTEVATYISVTGLGDVVVARHDKTGKGNFAASPSTVVSVDGTGAEIPDASEPSVSATGRYVAFTAAGPAGATADSTSVWRHDTDAAGDGTFHPGPTILVSCLPAGGTGSCAAAADADSPSISGDGSQVAFATIEAHDQVYVRSVTDAGTTVVSVPAGGGGGSTADGDSYAPSMSQDGSTVAYISTATNLAAKATPQGATNLYVRTLTPNAPLASELVSPSGASLPAGDDIALPSVDAIGGLIAFQTSVRLLPAAPPGVTSIYTFEREPALAFKPSPVDFGVLTVGSKAASLTVTVTDTGPGPGTVTTAGTTPPFGINAGACAGAELHQGDSCTVTVSLTPTQAGTDNGTLTATATDNLGAAGDFSVPVTVTIIAVTPPPGPHHHTEHARLTLDPGVAPAGQVTDVTGTGFLVGQIVTLSWDHGLGQLQFKLTKNSFTRVMVIFPDDVTGPRLLQARDLTGKVLATANFLVQQPTIWPPIGANGTPGGAGAQG